MPTGPGRVSTTPSTFRLKLPLPILCRPSPIWHAHTNWIVSLRSTNTTWRLLPRCANICAFQAWDSRPCAISATSWRCACEPSIAISVCLILCPSFITRTSAITWDTCPVLEQLGNRQSSYLLEKFLPGDVYHVDSVVSENEVVFANASQYGKPPMTVAQGGGIFTTFTVPRESQEDS